MHRLFRFQEHDIYLPMVVLEELDGIKKGAPEIARNVRQASRFLDDLMADADVAEIDAGLPIDHSFHDARLRASSGPLFFQPQIQDVPLPQVLAGGKADNAILGVTLALMQRFKERQIVLASKDINLRIKSTAPAPSGRIRLGDSLSAATGGKRREALQHVEGAPLYVEGFIRI